MFSYKLDQSIGMQTRQLRVKIKREKSSLTGTPNSVPDKTGEKPLQSNPSSDIGVFKVPAVPVSASGSSSSMNSKGSGQVEARTTNKKDTSTRKKKHAVHKPIKVERFSDINVMPSPVALRTRKGSVNRQQQLMNSKQSRQKWPNDYEEGEDEKRTDMDEGGKRAPSIYEDAVDSSEDAQQQQQSTTFTAVSAHEDAAVNGNKLKKGLSEELMEANTVEIGQTTFVVEPSLNTTVTLNRTMAMEATIEKLSSEINETYEVLPGLANTTVTTVQSNDEEHRSFVTAKDISEFRPEINSLMTEDDDEEEDDDDDKYHKIIGNKLKSQTAKNTTNAAAKVKNLPEIKSTTLKSKANLPMKTFKTNERPKELFK